MSKRPIPRGDYEESERRALALLVPLAGLSVHSAQFILNLADELLRNSVAVPASVSPRPEPSARHRLGRWQRMRLEVMERSDFSCERCGATEKTLNVHHINYRKGAMPWEYKLHELQCLCAPCHESFHLRMEIFREIAARLNDEDLAEVFGYACAVDARDYPNGRVDLVSEAALRGVANATHLSKEELRAAADERGAITGFAIFELSKAKSKT